MPEARHHSLFPKSLQRLFVLPVDLLARNRDLQVLLARPNVGDVDADLELALGLLRPQALAQPDSSLTETDVADSSSSVLIKGFPSSMIPAGWLDPPSRTRRARAKAANPGWHRSKSGRRDLNPRHPRWQRGALPLSYSRMSQPNQEMRPKSSKAVSNLLA